MKFYDTGIDAVCLEICWCKVVFKFFVQRKYLEALKKFDELLEKQKELYGDQNESVKKSS